MDVRLIDIDALKEKEQYIPCGNGLLFHGVTAATIDAMPTVNQETLPIVRELREEIDRLTNDGKQDLWAVERKRREQVEEELERVKKKLDKAVNQLHGYCPACKNYTANHCEGPCDNCKHEYYMYRDVGAVDNWEWEWK